MYFQKKIHMNYFSIFDVIIQYDCNEYIKVLITDNPKIMQKDIIIILESKRNKLLYYYIILTLLYYYY